jgi:tRNA-2-methylthio-N6-dimethylallyladenosine synthase
MASGIRHPVSGIRSTDFDRLDMGRDPRLTDAMAQAYVRVQEGCDRFCTYCIVPYVRGAENCRDPRHIVEEVGKLADTGHSEVTLLGQTVNRYRWSAGEATVRFSDLLSRVAGVAGLRRVRFVTSHPLDFGDDLLEAMRDLPNVCEYIHCPPQSGSDAVLKRMNRGYTRAQFDDLVDRARAIVPGVVLAGDFIVGFPGETEEDHQASMDLLRRSRFKNSFVFKYSPRPGTAAARKLADDVLDADKKRRNNELLAVQGEVGLAHHREYIGRTVEVLVEGPSLRAGKQPAAAPPGQVQLVGRTRWDHIVHFTAAPEIAGAYVNVRVTDATSLVMTGEMA